MLLRWVSRSIGVLWLSGIAVSDSFGSLPDNQFETLSYDAIVKQIHDLANDYPHLAKVYSAQDRYQLRSPGTCSTDGTVRCEQWVLHIADHRSLADNPERPEVFLSGCLHGDEQVGPTAVVEAAKLMVHAAACVDNPEECADESLKASPESVPWLARLALTRSIVIMPMTNSIGYYNTVRTENGLDPNRDFPYSQQADKCMTTITARAINEVWREHAFQLAVTFHGGMVGMAYEWGSPDHPHKKDKNGDWLDISPDHVAQKELTSGLSLFAGSFKEGGKTFKAYPTGRMNQLVYPVAGGMEDWAYAGSWGDAMGVCEPTHNGGYPKEKTIYNSATLRALNILVEASDHKHPPQSLLGSRLGLLDRSPTREEYGNGHVARNIRLSLMVVDLVEPYVPWLSASPPITPEKLNQGHATVVADERQGVDLEWTVGGAFEVDTTQLVWGPWPENSDSLTRKDWEDLAAAASVESRSAAQVGRSRWSREEEEGGEGARETIFQARFDLATLPDSGGVRFEIKDAAAAAAAPTAAFVMAVTSVDQAWGARLVKGWPDIGPQSHFVNARTSEGWLQENNGHVVRGRLEWVSAPIKVMAATPPPPPPPPAIAAAQTPPASTSPPDNERKATKATKGDEDLEGDAWGGGVGGGIGGEGAALPIKEVSPPSGGGSEAGGSVNTPVFFVLMVAAGLVLAGVLARARGSRRFGGGGGAGASSAKRRKGGGGVKGVSQGEGHHEGGISLGARVNPAGDALSRRRNQEMPSSAGSSGNGGADGRSGSLESRGLLSSIDETL